MNGGSNLTHVLEGCPYIGSPGDGSCQNETLYSALSGNLEYREADLTLVGGAEEFCGGVTYYEENLFSDRTYTPEPSPLTHF